VTRRDWRGVSVALVLAVATGLAAPAMAPTDGGTASAATLAAQPRLPGINAQWLPGGGSARVQAFNRITDLGVRIARMDGNWADVEKVPGQYHWDHLDAQVNELTSHGLSPRVILDYSNPLYSTRGNAAKMAGNGGIPPFGIGQPIYFPPDTNAPFATWAAALASRYRGRVHFLEVWNEQNLGWRFWEPPPADAGAYAGLLKATYIAVKAVAPEDQVAFGGTFYPAVDLASAAADGVPIPNNVDAKQLAAPHQGTLGYVASALQADPTLGAYFDALAYHPYHFPYMAPEVDIPVEGSLETSMVAVRALLDTNHLQAKPIWITEVGWPNNIQAYGATFDKSASYLTRTYATAWAHGIEQVDWYCYGDGGSDWTYNQEAAFGIVDTNGNFKPAYHAWQTLNRLVGTLPYLDSRMASLGLPATGHAPRFGTGASAVTVVWLAPETMYSDQGALPVADQRQQVPTPPGTVAIYDMVGKSLAVGATFEASPYPVYLVQAAGPGTPGGNPNAGPDGGLPGTATRRR
jgi:hypothetical protein